MHVQFAKFYVTELWLVSTKILTVCHS